MPYKDPDVRRAKQREYSAKHYENNRERCQEGVKRNKAKLYTWWREFKATLGCFGCEENDPSCLELHHVITDGKTESRDSANWWVYRNNWGPDRIQKEIWATCVPLCSNCHRKVHKMARELGKTDE